MKPSDSKHERWKSLNKYSLKDAHQKSEEGQWGPIKKKLDSFTLETSKNHLIRNFLRVRVKTINKIGLETNLLVHKMIEHFPFKADILVQLPDSGVGIITF